jgi:PST family polysaccharide transporter
VGFRAVSSLAVGKWIALSFGPAGTALFGQLMNLFSAFSGISNDGLARAVVKEAALTQQEGNEKGTATILSNGFILFALLYLFQCLVAFLVSRYTDWLEPFQSEGHLVLIVLGFGALTFSYFLGSLFLIWKKTNLQALLATCLSIGGLVGLGVAWWITPSLHVCLLGFLAGQALGGFLVFFLFKHNIAVPALRWEVDKNTLRTLFLFTLAVASSGLVHQIGIYGLVHWALETMGTKNVGLWMAMNRMADSFNTPILAVANSILLPLLAANVGQNEELRKIMKPIFRQSLAWLAVGFVLMFFLYPYLLPLLFSSEFKAEVPLVGWQLAGDFFKSSTYVFSILMLASGHTRFYFWLESASIAALLVLSWIFYKEFGFLGMFMAHAVRYFLYWSAIVWRYRSVFL